MYRVEFTGAALKGLARMPRREAGTMRARLDAIAADPYGRHPYAKAFGAGVFRVRVGDWRAVYELDGDRLVVVVIRVGHRSEVYRD